MAWIGVKGRLQGTDVKPLAALILSLASTLAWSAERSRTEVQRFKQMEPCPETGRSRGACPGWQVDHITPLCAGGADKSWNMQWIRTDDHRMKTHVDVRECRKMK